MRRTWRGLAEAPGMVLLSAAVAVLAWLWVQGQQVTSARVRVDLDLRVADSLVNTAAAVSSASAVVEGPLAAIRRAQLLRPSVVLDLTRERSGVHQVPLEGMPVLGLPAGLSVAGLNPEVVEVRLEPRVRRTLPVVAATAGAMPAGYRVGRVSAEPAEVAVSGSRSALAALESVHTRAVDVGSMTASGRVAAELELPAGVEAAEGWQGHVEVELVAETVRLTVSDVPVLVRGPPGWRAAEGSERLAVVIEGPQEVVRALALDRVVAVIELPAEPKGQRVTARFRAGQPPRLDVLLPREDVLRVVEPPGPVDVVRDGGR